MNFRTLLALALVLIRLSVYAGTPTEPKLIFTTCCASCHNVNKVLTRPALAGVDKRRTIDWIVKFVHSSQTVIRSGDAYATTLFEKYNRVTMPDHPDLSADDIKGIVEYIKTESKAQVNEKPPFTIPGKLHPDYHPLSIVANWPFFVCYVLFVSLLIGVMLLAVNVKSIERNAEKG